MSLIRPTQTETDTYTELTRTEPPETIRPDSKINRQGPRPDSESDHVKYKAAKRTLQSRSLRFLLTEKNQDLAVSAQRSPKSWVSLPREFPSLGSLCAEYNQDLVTSWQARHNAWDSSWQKGSTT